jgi:Fe-S-cluster containining protein
MGMPTSVKKKKDGEIRIGDWKVEPQLATARIEGGGPLNVADECRGRCCIHGVYAALPERDKILEYADRIQEAMDETQTTDTSKWFEEEIQEDEDFVDGVCIGTAVYNEKCAFLNGEGLCVLQMLEASLNLPPSERLKPFYCRLFPLTTWYGRLEFDDLCDGIRPCCTLASDGPTRAIDAYAFEFKQALGDEGYEEFRRVAEQLEAEQEVRKRTAGSHGGRGTEGRAG